MTNETQSSPAAGSADALREVVEDIQARNKLLSVRDIYKSFGTNASSRASALRSTTERCSLSSAATVPASPRS